MNRTSDAGVGMAGGIILLLAVGLAPASFGVENVDDYTSQEGHPSNLEEHPGPEMGPSHPEFGMTAEIRNSARAAVADGNRRAKIVFSHPMTMGDLLGVDFGPVNDYPLEVFLEELQASGEDDIAAGMNRIFNVRLEMPGREVTYPGEATLQVRVGLEFTDIVDGPKERSFSVGVPMYEKEPGTYYILHPQDFSLGLNFKIGDLLNGETPEDALRSKPTITISHFDGFTFDKSTVRDFIPTGELLTYQFRFGDVVVDRGHQWAGRPAGLFGYNKDKEFVR